MPSLTEDYNMTLSSVTKKRKHSDPDERQFQYETPSTLENPLRPGGTSSLDRRPPSLTHIISSHHNSDVVASNALLTRKIQSLPLKKRARTLDPEEHRSYPHDQQYQGRPGLSRLAANPVGAPSKNLSPCHICHRKPQRKADLDSYKGCEGCGRQTCYICIRECHNWMSERGGDGGNREEEYVMIHQSDPNNSRSFEMRDAGDHHYAEDDDEKSKVSPDWWKHHRGHRSIICSKCCVETGPEGETMCLACLAFVDEGKDK